MQQRLESNQKLQKIPYQKVNWRVWWKQMRPHTLTASFTPVIIGTVLALPHGSIHVPVFLCMLLASMMIQAATNLFNEYFDYKRGLDTADSVGIGGATVHYGIEPRVILILAVTLFAATVPLGVYICMNSSWWIAVIGVACMAAGYFYTGGPYPVAYTPFGELTAGIFMGLILILLSFFIQTGTITTVSVLVSIPMSILVGSILMANNIRDLRGDKAHGRKTLAILLGHSGAVSFLGGMFALSYLWMIALVTVGYASPWLLLVLLSLPKAWLATLAFVGKTTPAEMMPAMKATSQTHTFFGLLLAAGIVCAHLFS
ncbi:1,4-dihydroxy-2-naphthoate polyprenyltransferase [Numidum massiliense]|uniref:1,4-dihydroxy-2-naphthoate polyprenyltransferase n=1 Tax=Numidum massiliense TaxID=1522315 RepID=UPI0006D57608|nr:1,4-dihydroxy-2-naphthoate polyprenyltransferase [Numidum massiliense]